jgi:hypothetical protein
LSVMTEGGDGTGSRRDSAAAAGVAGSSLDGDLALALCGSTRLLSARPCPGTLSALISAIILVSSAEAAIAQVPTALWKPTAATSMSRCSLYCAA